MLTAARPLGMSLGPVFHLDPKHLWGNAALVLLDSPGTQRGRWWGTGLLQVCWKTEGDAIPKAFL